MLRAYKYRLLPDENQRHTLSKWMGCCRFVYNLALEAKSSAWSSAQKNVSSYDLMKQLTELVNTEATWLRDCPRQSLESAITNLDKAYKGFFKGGGFPSFKNRSSTQSVTFRQDSLVKENKVRLTKIGFVDFIQHRPLPKGEIRTVVVSKTPTNKYFVSILVRDESELPEKKPILEKTSIGIDVGLKTFATLSDGKEYHNPKFLNEQLTRLRVELRTLSRRFQKGKKIVDQSKGWHKQRMVVAKLHEKIANKRTDFLHKVSAELIKQYDTICIETLNISGMLQNGNLSKAISDVSWSKFMQFVKYKAEWNGKNVIEIGTFEPSSKTCSVCGFKNIEIKLSDREWECKKCNTLHDRDLNAAKNIKNIGLQAKPSLANVT